MRAGPKCQGTTTLSVAKPAGSSVPIYRLRSWFCVTGLALAIRVVALVAIGHPEILEHQLTLRFDEPSYNRTAKTLAMTGHYSEFPNGPPTAYRPPGAVLPLAALYHLFGPFPGVGIAYTITCSVALVAAV